MRVYDQVIYFGLKGKIAFKGVESGNAWRITGHVN